jgi:Fe2+ or Zn2+ uptake regulation protein
VRPDRAPAPDLREELAGLGLRLTAQRRLILGLLRATDRHPTAEWVHAEVRRRLPRVSLGTVYRNLRQLVEGGLLAEVRQGPSARFDARLDRHHHFTCAACARIFDLAEPPDPRLDARVTARTGFHVSHHRIEFFGRCADCGPDRGERRRRGGRVAARLPSPPTPTTRRRHPAWPSR